MAKVNQQKPKESDEPVAIEYKGNELVTAEQQRTYAELMLEIKNDPAIGKLVLGEDYTKMTMVIAYLILKELRKR
jgi:hypothetical protein